MATGVLPLTFLQLGKETTAGTAVVTTRELYPSPVGYFDPGVMVSHHEGSQRGTFSNVTHGTVIGYRPTIGFASEPSTGLSFDDLVYPMSQLASGLTGTGTLANKTWAASSAQTSHTFDTFTANLGSNQQALEVEYCFATGFSISMGDQEGLTQWGMDLVGRQTTKVTVDTVAANNAVKVTNAAWTIKYATAQSGLTGASALANTLRSFSLDVVLPQRPQFYGDGNLYFGQGLASENLGGTLTMVWDTTDDAEVQYDRMLTQSTSFFRLKNAGPTLGGGTYEVGIDVAVIWGPSGVKLNDGEIDGVSTTTLVGDIVYDSTWAEALLMDTVNSLSAVP